MLSKRCIVSVAVLSLVTITGCPDIWENQPALFLVGVTDGQACLQHFAEWSGFDTLPSTLWTVDTDTGATDSLQTAVTQYDVQTDGEYYVAERPTTDNQGSQVVAVEIASDEEIVVLERDVVLGGRYDREFVLVDGIVVARTDDGLLLYDLDARAVLREIELDDPIVEIHAASAKWALVRRDNVHAGDDLIVNLTTGDVDEVPALPGDATGYFYDAAIVGDDVLTSSWVESAAGISDLAVQTLNISTLTWDTLAEFDGTGSGFTPQIVYVDGADETHVLIQVFKAYLGCRLEVVERVTGDRTLIAEMSGLMTITFDACLDGGVVYWIDTEQNKLRNYTIDGGAEHTVPLDDVAP